MSSILKAWWARSEESRANCGFETQSLWPQINFSIGTTSVAVHGVIPVRVAAIRSFPINHQLHERTVLVALQRGQWRLLQQSEILRSALLTLSVRFRTANDLGLQNFPLAQGGF